MHVEQCIVYVLCFTGHTGTPTKVAMLKISVIYNTAWKTLQLTVLQVILRSAQKWNAALIVVFRLYSYQNDRSCVYELKYHIYMF